MKIISIQHKHLNEIVEIYMNVLNMASITYFGKSYILKMCHHLLDNNWGYAALDEKSNKIIGFIFSSKSTQPFFSFLSIRSILHLCFIIFTNYLSFIIFFNSFFKIFLPNLNLNKKNIIEIAHFAVDKNYQNIGIGSKLIKYFEERSILENYKSIYTTTHNKRLAKFYSIKMNAKIIKIKKLSKHYTSHQLMWDLNK